MVRPQLEYAAPILNPHRQTEINRTEVQRTAAHWTYRRWRNQSHVGEMLDELQWPELQEQRQQVWPSSIKYPINWSPLPRKGTCLRLVEWIVLPDPTHFSITVRMHIQTDWNFLTSPGQSQLGMDLQPKLSLRRQLMGLSPKYGLGRDMAWMPVHEACLLIGLTEVALS